MKLTHGSLFAGIGGFDLGFERVGIETVWTVENDKNCNQVLATHWPDVKGYGDVREVGKRNLEPIDIISGGFPCQDLSVAGRRAGLAGERSGLWVEFARIIEEMEAQWVVVENVPGLFSSNGGTDFAVIIRVLELFGYCVAWRVLDSQYFGVPQRRRRVFIVGSLGGTGSVKVLFESEGSERHPTEGKEAWQRIAAPIKASSPSSRRGGSNPIAEEFVVDSSTVAEKAGTLQKHESLPSQEAQNLIAFGGGNMSGKIDKATTCNAHGSQRYDFESETFVSWDLQQITSRDNRSIPREYCPTLNQAGQMMTGVRRLTPTECERLQGFPDGWTEGLSDSARYRCLGNAVTVNVAEWIGRRIVVT